MKPIWKTNYNINSNKLHFHPYQYPIRNTKPTTSHYVPTNTANVINSITNATTTINNNNNTLNIFSNPSQLTLASLNSLVSQLKPFSGFSLPSIVIFPCSLRSLFGALQRSCGNKTQLFTSSEPIFRVACLNCHESIKKELLEECKRQRGPWLISSSRDKPVDFIFRSTTLPTLEQVNQLREGGHMIVVTAASTDVSHLQHLFGHVHSFFRPQPNQITIYVFLWYRTLPPLVSTTIIATERMLRILPEDDNVSADYKCNNTSTPLDVASLVAKPFFTNLGSQEGISMLSSLVSQTSSVISFRMPLLHKVTPSTVPAPFLLSIVRSTNDATSYLARVFSSGSFRCWHHLPDIRLPAGTILYVLYQETRNNSDFKVSKLWFVSVEQLVGVDATDYRLLGKHNPYLQILREKQSKPEQISLVDSMTLAQFMKIKITDNQALLFWIVHQDKGKCHWLQWSCWSQQNVFIPWRTSLEYTKLHSLAWNMKQILIDQQKEKQQNYKKKREEEHQHCEEEEEEEEEPELAQYDKQPEESETYRPYSPTDRSYSPVTDVVEEEEEFEEDKVDIDDELYDPASPDF